MSKINYYFINFILSITMLNIKFVKANTIIKQNSYIYSYF